MRSFTNRYGLAPERVYQGGSGAAEASPLSWCAAETALAVLVHMEELSRPGTPVVDGEVHRGEYRPWGPAGVDMDGAPDRALGPVVLHGPQVEETL